MSSIHSTAVVSPTAKIGSGTTVGPFAVIEDGVVIGRDCEIAAHAIVKYDCVLGDHNEVGERAVLGGKPQHLKAGGKLGGLILGDGNMLRENVTIHRGLTPGENTILGHRNLLMVNAHVAHDCILDNETILANNTMLAGHIHVESKAYLSGAAGVHQFCRIGRCAMVGGQAHIKQDVLPFVTVDGFTSLIVGLNVVGMRRSGISSAEIQDLKQAYRLLFRSGKLWSEAVRELHREDATGLVAEWNTFLAGGKRGFVSERRAAPAAATVAFRQPAESEELPLRRAS